MDRKTVEKNRRIQMKHLCLKLVSHLPSPHFNSPKEVVLSQLDQLEMATNYIVELRERVQKLKERKTQLEMQPFVIDSKYPIMEIRDLGLFLEVNIVSRSRKSFKLFQVLSLLGEEGAQVVGVNVATFGNEVYHTLHVQVKSSILGVETSRIGGRLHQLISNGYM